MRPLLRIFHMVKNQKNEDELELIIGIETSHNIIYGYRKDNPQKIGLTHIDDEAIISRVEAAESRYDLVRDALNSNWANIRAAKKLRLTAEELMEIMLEIDSILEGITLNVELEYLLHEIALLEKQNETRWTYLLKALS